MSDLRGDVEKLFTLVRDRYSYLEEKKKAGVELEALRATALEGVKSLKSDVGFYHLMRETVAGLRDGHCEVDRGRLSVSLPKSTWPVTLRIVEEGVIITDIHELAADNGFHRGDLLKEVNGQPIASLIKRTAAMVSASTDGARQRMALQRVIQTDDDSVSLRVESPDGRIRDVTARTRWMPVPAVPPLKDLPAGKFLDARILENGIGYIRLTSMSWGLKPCPNMNEEDRRALFKPVQDLIDIAFEKIAKTKLLILDVRGNSGGYDDIGAHIAGFFVPRSNVYVLHQRRSVPESEISKPAISRYTSPDVKRYEGGVAVLIDEGSFSATDTLAAALLDWRPDVAFVGRRTHGGAGGPEQVAKLDHTNMGVYLCVLRLWSPKEKRLIEREGTRPTVPVKWTRADILNWRDPDLEAAQRILLK